MNSLTKKETSMESTCFILLCVQQYYSTHFKRSVFVAADFVWSDDWKEFRNHTYKYFEDSAIVGVRAEEECKKIGTLLVSINNPDEADFIANSVLKRRTLSAIIGATDREQGRPMCLRMK